MALFFERRTGCVYGRGRPGRPLGRCDKVDRKLTHSHSGHPYGQAFLMECWNPICYHCQLRKIAWGNISMGYVFAPPLIAHAISNFNEFSTVKRDLL
jgi:hypothetical protein